MNFNVPQNSRVPPNVPIPQPEQQPFMVGNPNIAPNMIQQQPPFMMMNGMPSGFTNPYPFSQPVMEQQQNKQQENNMAQPGIQQSAVNPGQSGFAGSPNLNPIPTPFGFHGPIMPQPNIITAPPTVIPQPSMPNLMHNPQIISPPMINPQMMNNPMVNMANNQAKTAPPMPTRIPYPMKPLIDTLLNPVVVKVPEKDDTPKLTNVVYVGGLTTDTKNEFVINMLQKCGKTSHFKRHTDPSSGLLSTFAFCDFESPGGAYFAIECLADLDFGENKLKVSCNSRVKCQIDDWKEGKIEEMCIKNPDKSKEEVIKEFDGYKHKLRSEFVELIALHFKSMQDEEQEQEDDEDEEEETQKVVTKETKEKPAKEKEEPTGLTKEYSIHRKETDRIFKLRQKKRNYDNKYKEQLSEWIEEEEKLFRRIRALFEVSQSKREKLIDQDISGKSKANLKNRSKEIEEDKKDEQDELDENKSKKISVKLSTQAPAAPVSTEQAPKKPKVDDDSVTDRNKVVNLFREEAEEVTKKTLTEEEIWEMVPKTNILEHDLDWDVLFSINLSILIEPWIRRCILEYMGDEDSLVNDVLEFIFSKLKERPKAKEVLSEVEQFLDEESEGFVTQLWRLLYFHQTRLKNL